MKNLQPGRQIMKNETLQGINEFLGGLPVLEQRKERLLERLVESKAQLVLLKAKYDTKAGAVLKHDEEGLSAAFRKFASKYNGRMDKETQEMLAAKQEYDKERVHLNDLEVQKQELDVRIKCLIQNKSAFELELERREVDIGSHENHDLYEAYIKIKMETTKAASQLVENEEALIVAGRVLSTASASLKELERAEGWVTSDMWGGSGLVGRTTKFNKMDTAQATFNRLSSQLKDLERELADVQLEKSVVLTTISSTERMVAFWFDNILAGRDITSLLRSNQAQIRALIHQITELIEVLTKNENEIQAQLNLLEQEKDALIITCRSCQSEDGEDTSCALRGF